MWSQDFWFLRLCFCFVIKITFSHASFPFPHSFYRKCRHALPVLDLFRVPLITKYHLSSKILPYFPQRQLHEYPHSCPQFFIYGFARTAELDVSFFPRYPPLPTSPPLEISPLPRSLPPLYGVPERFCNRTGSLLRRHAPRHTSHAPLFLSLSLKSPPEVGLPPTKCGFPWVFFGHFSVVDPLRATGERFVLFLNVLGPVAVHFRGFLPLPHRD